MDTVSYIFVIQSGDVALLHPFYTGSSIYSLNDSPHASTQIAGRYGLGFEALKTDQLRTTLLEATEKCAKRHFLDKAYYWRIGLAALSFIVVYLFFSIFVRDPIPVVDELLLGGLAAGFCYLFMERATLKSRKFLDALSMVRRSLDTSFFEESRVVSLVEAWRDEIVTLGAAAFYRTGLYAPPVEFTASESEEAEAFCEYCVERWRHKPIVGQLYNQLKNDLPPGRLLDRMTKKMGIHETALVLAYIRLLRCLPVSARDGKSAGKYAGD